MVLTRFDVCKYVISAGTVLEIHTGPPVRGWQLWRRTDNFGGGPGTHYDDVIISEIESRITSLTTVYLIVYSCADQRKHQSSASLAFLRGIHRRPVNSPHKGPVSRKMVPFDDVIMFCWFFFNFMFMIWDSWHEDLQLFWLSFKHWAGMVFIDVVLKEYSICSIRGVKIYYLFVQSIFFVKIIQYESTRYGCL